MKSGNTDALERPQSSGLDNRPRTKDNSYILLYISRYASNNKTLRDLSVHPRFAPVTNLSAEPAADFSVLNSPVVWNALKVVWVEILPPCFAVGRKPAVRAKDFSKSLKMLPFEGLELLVELAAGRSAAQVSVDYAAQLVFAFAGDSASLFITRESDYGSR